MARVFLSTGLRRFTGGAGEIDVDAETVQDLIAALEARFPGIEERLGSGIAVAIDGDVMPNALYEPIAPSSEIHFLAQVSGG
ncbi:MAG: MoaD/ThiS family protein [Acidimicrobiia bacterium]